MLRNICGNAKKNYKYLLGSSNPAQSRPVGTKPCDQVVAGKISIGIKYIVFRRQIDHKFQYLFTDKKATLIVRYLLPWLPGTLTLIVRYFLLRFDEVFLSEGNFPPCRLYSPFFLRPHPINDVSHSGGARFQLRFHCPMLCWGFASSIVLIPH